MDIDIWKVFASLGVPGLALGVFYMLFKSFHWKFPSVPRVWVGPLILLFMLIVGSITLYALTLWAPVNANGGSADNDKTKVDDSIDKEKIARLIAPLKRCSLEDDSSKVISYDLIYKFANPFYQTEWVYRSLNPRLTAKELDYPIRQKQDSIENGFYIARFCLYTEDKGVTDTTITIGARDHDKRLQSTRWEQLDEKAYGTAKPLVLIDQPDPDWVITKSAKWLTSSEGKKRLVVSLYNPFDTTYPGANISMALGDSYMYCISTGSTQIMKVALRKSADLDLRSEDPDLGELIERTANIQLGPCGEHDLRLDFGEFSSLSPKEENRIIYTFEISGDSDGMNPDYLSRFKYGAVFIDSEKVVPNKVNITNFDAL
ncbi:hypothetical protein CWC29_002155 [Pseudoalteromonas sp. S4498]|uniref:hypothetical protein n=1 Tax=Pseudoalteromonas galatheae TaxID=579562 RepID=UPI001107BD9E|nr:hypothetical protein [Pseudoalteromonas galatheae]NKC17655.1 hypothetical protein [Pseudoalteromonas galatheae]